MDIMVDAAMMSAIGELLGEDKVVAICTKEEVAKIGEICEVALSDLESTLGEKESDDELAARLLSIFREYVDKLLAEEAVVDAEQS
jgi:hypothetical protein